MIEGTMKLFDISRRESQETPEQTLARLNARTLTATPVSQVPTVKSEGLGERLADISQRRWRLICVAVWLCIAMVAWIVFMLVDAYWPDSTSDDAMTAAFVATVVAFFAFWKTGIARTNHISPNEWTTLQRSFKYRWDHPGR